MNEKPTPTKFADRESWGKLVQGSISEIDGNLVGAEWEMRCEERPELRITLKIDTIKKKGAKK